MAEEEQVDRYACKQCRRVLFTSNDLMEHEPERHEITYRRKLKDAKTKSLKSGVIHVDGCSSFFLEEVLSWMDQDALDEGKLKCPNEKCQSRVGSFDWSGSQCSCGSWVTPSIKITKSRVDLLLSMKAIPIVSTIMDVPTYKAEEEKDSEPTDVHADAQTEAHTAPVPAVAVSIDELTLDE